MEKARSDALVFFGASGDLAYKKIFPALQSMVRRGRLDVPIIGVANTPWTLEQFRARAKESIQKHGARGLGSWVVTFIDSRSTSRSASSRECCRE